MLARGSSWLPATCWPDEVSDAGLQDNADFKTIHRTFLYHVGKLEKMLLDKHEQEVGRLRAENQRLGEQLRAVARGEAVHLDFRIEGVDDAEPSSPRVHRHMPSRVFGKSMSTSSLGNFGASNSEPRKLAKKTTREMAEEVAQHGLSPQTVGDIEGGVGHNNTSRVGHNQKDRAASKDVEDSHSRGRKKHHSRRALDNIFSQDLSLLQRVVFSRYFEVFSGVIILANSALMCLQLQYDGLNIGFELGYPKYGHTAEETMPAAKEVFVGLDIVFNSIFISELLLRIVAMGFLAPRSLWIWFDTAIVSISAIDCFLGAEVIPVNPGMLRILRLVKVFRLFKILQSMSAFDSLFLLLKAMVASCPAALWSFFFLLGAQMVVGLLLCQLLQTFLTEDATASQTAKHQVFQYFGTFSATMFTMFEITMANWAAPARVLCEDVSEGFMLFFVMYRCLFCFAVLKVIAAVFITETNRVLDHDDELNLMKAVREQNSFDRKVRRLIKSLDTFDGENIGFQELQELSNDDEVAALLSPLGFGIMDLEKLFFLIDAGSGQVHVDEFLNKISKVKGPAKAIDMLTMLKIGRRIDDVVSEVLGSSAETDDAYEQRLVEHIILKT